MLENLKKEVCSANLELVKRKLVILTWGNVSGFDPQTQYMVIKPSGVHYNELTPNNMVVVDLEGRIVEGNFKPSCDTQTHIELYKNYPELRGIVHTHSTYATSFAQAGRAIFPYGTTHADYFCNEIICTRQLTKAEVENGYEINTGRVIVEALSNKKLRENNGILVKCHGVFAWGSNPMNAVDNAQTIEQIAKMAFLTQEINANISPLETYIINKHYERKHGGNAYYGQ